MSGRFTAEWVVHVARPVDEVFTYLADVRRHHEWSQKPYRLEALADGPIVKGTTFTSVGWIPGDSQHRNDVEVTEYDPPRRFALLSREKGETFVNAFELTPEGDGTRVRRTADWAKPGGVRGAIFPLLAAGFIKPVVGKGMRLFKEKAEALPRT